MTTTKNKINKEELLKNFNNAYNNYVNKRYKCNCDEEFGKNNNIPNYSQYAYKELSFAEKQLSECVFQCFQHKIDIVF